MVSRAAMCAAAVVLCAAMSACGSAGNGMQTATFTARDFNFAGPQTLRAGVARFVLVNAGTRAHMLGIVSLGDGKTVDDLLADVKSHPDEPLPRYAIQLGGPDAVDPGAVSIGYADLKPGRYAVYCQMPDGNTGRSHLDLGMAAGFTVTADQSLPLSAAPSASNRLEATEFSYQLEKPVAAGSQTLRVHNGGNQIHEAQLARLPAGVTVDQYMALNDATSITAGASYGGLAAIEPGADGYFNAYFTPGSYAFICFVTDPQTGKPHFLLGQILQFNVP